MYCHIATQADLTQHKAAWLEHAPSLVATNNPAGTRCVDLRAGGMARGGRLEQQDVSDQ